MNQLHSKSANMTLLGRAHSANFIFEGNAMCELHTEDNVAYLFIEFHTYELTYELGPHF